METGETWRQGLTRETGETGETWRQGLTRETWRLGDMETGTD